MAVEDVVLLVADVIDDFFFGAEPQWGLYQDGVPVVVAETVLSMEYKQNWAVSTFPVEEGGFATYNKVATPFEVRGRFASATSVSDRQDLINSIADIAGTTELFDFVTPEATYPSVNVTHYDYRRSATNGLGLLSVDVWLMEVRVTAIAEFSNTKTPTAAGQVSGGSVQPQPPTDAQAATFSQRFGSN